MEQIAGYRIDQLIGRGGMGVVYRAEHMHLRRTVALKVLAPEVAEAEGFRERFIHEARVAARIDHPAIVTVYDAGEADGQLYLAMRYVEGSDLSSVLRSEGRLEPERALALLEQVAAALDAAHAHGLVHRDVKPANVLLQGERAYLTDFGLTKHTSARTAFTATGQFVGTIDYVAPEQIRGGDLGAHTDIYALGCVLYECLSGLRPFPRDTDVAALYAHLEEPPPRPSEHGLPAALDDVIGRALAKRPEERPSSCSELVREARTALAEPATEVAAVPEPPTEARAQPAPPAPEPPVVAPPEPATVAAAPPTASTRALRERRRRRPWAWGAGAAAAATVGIGVVLLTGGSEEPPPPGDPAAEREQPPPEDPAAPSIAVGEEPAGVAIRSGSVWITNSGDGTVSRIDQRQRRVTQTEEVGAAPHGIGAGQGAIWVANSGAGTVSRLSPESGDPLGEPVAVGERPWAVAIGVGDGSVWVANSGDGTVSRIDASSGTAGAPIEVGEDPRAIGTTRSSVWVANTADDTLTRIDVASGRPDEPVAAGDEPVAIAIRDGVLWVANRGDGTVSRLDNSSGEPISDPVRVGGRPSAVWVGERFAWVADEEAGTVQRVDPDNGRIVGEPLRVGDGPVALRTDEGVAWVVSREDGSVTPLEV